MGLPSLSITSWQIVSADAMASRVESRFDDDIFDDIATRQQASQSEGRVGVPLSENSLYLAPPIDKPGE